VTREALVSRVMAAEGTEAQRLRWMTLISRNVPHPAWSNLIYYPEPGAEVTPEAVVDAALAYQPIRL
jgi:Colicin immunity protein / pyocin immunity protein